MEDRVIGALMGQAVGDALGTRYEFTSSAAAQNKVEKDVTSSGHLPMLGGGPFRLTPGQITDDTELALIVARRFVGVSPVGLMYIASGFTDWFLSGPFDIGGATRTAFSQIDPSLPIETKHAKMMENAQRNMDSLSNGCLMKISPVALLGILRLHSESPYSDDEIADFAAGICKLTNPNPIAIDACRVYVLAIRDAIRGHTPRMIWRKALKNAQTEIVRTIIDSAGDISGPALAIGRDPVPVDGSGQGYLGVALQLAFFELLNGQSFEQSLTRTVSRGGDTDTNGCIVGALLGAYYGYSEIPADWTKTVLNVKTDRQKRLPEVRTNDLISLALRLGLKR